MVIALTVLLACKFGADPGAIIALDVAAPDSLEEYATLRPRARALTAGGDSAAAAVLWATLDSTVLTVLNAATGHTVVRQPGSSGRLEAAIGALVSNPLTIRTLAAADTLFPPAGTRDSVHVAPQAADSLSDSLTVALADTITLTGGGDSLVYLAGRPIVFRLSYYPAPVDSVTLVPNGPGDTSHARVAADTVVTSAVGRATVRVRWLGGPLPDSVQVIASAQRAVGSPVRGSPESFVVTFLP